MSNLTIQEYTIAQQDALSSITLKTQDAVTNTQTLNTLNTNLNNEGDNVELRTSGITPRLTNVNNQVTQYSGSFDLLIEDENELLGKIKEVNITSFSIILGGDINHFYPLWFTFDKSMLSFLEISRTPELNTNLFGSVQENTPGCYMYITGCGYDPDLKIPGKFTIRKFDEINSVCIALPNSNMYCSKESGSGKGYYAVGVSGLYLRGGLTYNFRTNDSNVKTNLETLSANSLLAECTFIGLDTKTYYTTPLDYETVKDMIWDESLYADSNITPLQPVELPGGIGDTAMHSGGMLASYDLINTIQKSFISTGSDAIATGSLTASLSGCSSASNGINDIAIATGGNTDAVYDTTDIIQQAVVSTGTDTVNTGVLISTTSEAAIVSNGIDDTMTSFGGKYYYWEKLDIIQQSIISTGADAVNTGALSILLYRSSGASNGVNDRAIITGGYFGGHTDSVSSNTIRLCVLSTATGTTDTGTLTQTLLDSHTTVSNGIDDMAITCGGTDWAEDEKDVVQRSIISTGASSVDVGTISVPITFAGGTSNAEDDTALLVGGRNDIGFVNNIQQYNISTGTTSFGTGILLNECGGVFSCSNC